MSDTVKAYKGFDADLKCRGFQYVEGATFTHDGPVSLCSSGFHAATQPIDVLRYYPPSTSVFHEVELEEVAARSDGDSKVAGRVIRIGARIDLPALIKAQVDFVFANAKPVAGASSKEANAAVKAEVEHGAATASGDSGAATASGDFGAATASGYSGAATASGYSGAATASGENSVAVATGRDGRARGALGSWIVLTERDDDWNILGVQAVPVDGEAIQADVFYALRGGKVVTA